MDMTQTEIDELRAAHARVTRPTRDYLPTDTPDKKLLRDSTLIPRLLAALEEARAERDRARQKIQAMEEQAMADEDGMSMRPLDGRLRKVEAERDALKEKLAALVTDIEAAMHFVNHTACLPVCGLYCTPPSRCTCGVNDIRNALAAAKVQPTDLDQLTR